MDEEIIGQGEILVDIVLDQINTLLIFLARPVVQRQIMAIIIIVLVAFLVPRGVKWWWQKRTSTNPANTQPSGRQQWITRLYKLYAPLIGIVLTYVTLWFFERQNYPNGLVESSKSFFWFWLAFRVLLMVLYAKYGGSVKPYDRWALTPAFILILLWMFLGKQAGLFTQLSAAPIIQSSGFTLTMGNIFSSLVVLYIFLVGAWIIERVLNRTLQGRLDAEPGLIHSIATLSRYAISALGIVVALSALGMDASSLALVAGGLSVGIGIGLQEIVANFVSGLTLLFEQSLRPGDVIELGGQVSQVDRVSLRTTTVTTRDNIKMIIPNAAITTQPLTTLTKGDRLVRVMIPLGVAYNTEPKQIREVAVQTATRHQLVLKHPPPVLFFRGFGDFSLNFELAIWTNQPDLSRVIISDLYYALFSAFKKSDIEIPFPQRDLNLRQGWDKLSVETGS